MKQELIDKGKNLALNLLGSSLLAFGICAFVEPFNMIVGGATGISLIIHRLFGLNVSIVALIINLAVLVPGWFLGGKKLVMGSVISSLFYPVAMAVFEKFPSLTTLADTPLLAAICGGVVCGAGIGLVIRSGGSTGGVDIPILLLHKYTRIPVNKIMNATDTLIMVSQIPFSVVTNIIYGLIYTYIMTRSLEQVLTFGADRMKLTIVSEYYEEICKSLTSNDFGVTMIYAEGGYTRTPIEQLECVMISRRIRYAQRLVEEIDPTAFITLEKVKDVKGRGFTMEREWIEMDD